MSFKSYLVESQVTDFHADIGEYIKNGMIPNPKYQELKSKVDRHVEKIGQSLFNKHVSGTAGKWYNISDDAGNLSDASWVRGINDVGSLRKKLDKAKKVVGHEQMWHDIDDFEREYKPLHDKMKHLKTLVVKTTALRAAAKETKAAEHKKKYGDVNPLQTALTKHLEDYKAKAHEYAGEHYDKIMTNLEKHGGDIDKAAPRGNSIKDSKDEYLRKNRWRALLMSMSEHQNGKIYKKTKAKKSEYQEKQKAAAHDHYMAWVHKMTTKVGKPVAQADMSGDPWTGSRLHVTTHDGEEQHWNTKMILNRSKYDTLFNQFPSRRVKK